jgi:hypothetical protein
MKQSLVPIRKSTAVATQTPPPIAASFHAAIAIYPMPSSAVMARAPT